MERPEHQNGGKSMVRSPPDEDSLDQHCKRVNYLSFCQKNFDLIEHPSPIGHGWDMVDGRCRPGRFTESALPGIFLEKEFLNFDRTDSDTDGE